MYNGRQAEAPQGDKKERLLAFILACGRYAYEQDVLAHGGKIRKGKGAARPRKPRSSVEPGTT